MASKSPSPEPPERYINDIRHGLGPSSHVGFLPLQDPDVLLSRSHLAGLLLARKASSDNFRHHAHSPTRPDRSVLDHPNMRYMRLIGNSNPRYEWEQYRKTPEELRKMKKPIREYYEKNNRLVEHYIYIDKLLDSTLPRDLLRTYHDEHELSLVEDDQLPNRPFFYGNNYGSADSLLEALHSTPPPPPQRKRPSAIYKVADEESPLLGESGGDGVNPEDKARIVTIAIWINFIANALLLVAKLSVALLTSSLSVLASLVDGILDFLSTVIVATTTRLVERSDQHSYPIGRARLEPLGVLVFAVIMIVSFVQVGLEAIERLLGPSRIVIHLTPIAIGIMASTVVIKGACWLWCRLIKNSSVQALAEDAITDVIFNFFSVLFPLVGAFTDTWWLDPLGGLVLSIYVICQWSRISHGHIKNLTGAAASPEQRNVILYLVMRFAKSIKQITSVQAYHAGDRLNVEVDLVLDNAIELKDSHDLGESLTYVLESLPIVDRAFVHLDYDSRNPPGHLR